jgi:hypothetical protein
METSLIDSKHRQDLKFIQSVQNSKRKVFNERTKVKNPWCHDDRHAKSEPFCAIRKSPGNTVTHA